MKNKNTRIVLPHGVKLRDYQQKAWNIFFLSNIKHLMLIWHRRAGKTKFAVNLISGASQKRIGAYYYLFPKLTQARRVVWEGRGEDGFRFIDHFPKHMIKHVNNTDMKIEFKNGSIFRLLGTDNLHYENIVGGNPLGILYDEFALQNPVARDYLMPIIAENGGWEVIISTPRGTNHLYELYEQVLNRDDWYVNKLTIDETFRDNGRPIVNKDTVEELRLGGWSEDKVNQEFYCSFTAAVRGAYFADELRQAERDNRILDFGVDPTVPVCTYWDLGYDDATAIWLAQHVNGQIRLIAYYEENLKPISHFINWIRDYRDRHGLVFNMHFGPHDTDNHHGSTGKSNKDVAQELGFHFEVVPRVQLKRVAIDSAKNLIHRCIFHKTNCKQGLSALREYHKSYDERRQDFADKPYHNWASHGADAFMTLAQSANITNNPYSQVESISLLADFQC